MMQIAWIVNVIKVSTNRLFVMVYLRSQILKGHALLVNLAVLEITYHLVVMVLVLLLVKEYVKDVIYANFQIWVCPCTRFNNALELVSTVRRQFVEYVIVYLLTLIGGIIAHHFPKEHIVMGKNFYHFFYE
jgi:hypothetical protein